MATAIPVLMVLGTVMSVAATVQAGKQRKKTAEYNATIATQNATLVSQKAQVMADRKRKATNKMMGRQRALLGASGISIDSFRDVLDEQIELGETDALNLEYGGMVEAQGFQNTASLDRASGSNAKNAALFSGASQALQGGVSSYKYSQGITT